MILSHSPLRDYVKDFGDKFVLVSGTEKSPGVLKDYGYKKIIELEEMFALHPELGPSTAKWYPESELMEKKRKLLKRFPNFTES